MTLMRFVTDVGSEGFGVHAFFFLKLEMVTDSRMGIMMECRIDRWGYLLS